MFFSAHVAQRKGDGTVGPTLGTLGWVYGEYQTFQNFMRHNAKHMQSSNVYIIEAHTSRDNWKNNVKPVQVHVHATSIDFDAEIFLGALEYTGE